MDQLTQLDARIAELVAVRATLKADTPAETWWDLDDKIAELRAKRANLIGGNENGCKNKGNNILG